MSARQSFREWAAGSTLAHVAFAFIAMGGWAVYANSMHSLPDMLLAGLLQGMISALLTLGLKKFVEWFNARLGKTLALVLPPMITATTILLILLTAHTLAGTPEIVRTVALPFSVSTTYAILYNLRLWKVRFP